MAPDDDAPAAEAEAGIERGRDPVAAGSAADLPTPFGVDSTPGTGVHVLVVGEVLYAPEADLLDPAAGVASVEATLDDLEIVQTDGHSGPTFLGDHADPASEVPAEKRPLAAGQLARRGPEY